MESLNKKWMPTIVSKLAISIGVSSAIGAIAGGVGAFFGAKKAGIGNAGKGFLTSGGVIAGGVIGSFIVTKLFKRITISAKAQEQYSEALSELITKYTGILQTYQNRNLPAPDMGIVETAPAETPIPNNNTTQRVTPRSPSFAAQADIEKTQAMQTVKTLH